MIPTEEVEQANFVQWLEIKGYRFTSIPNSTYTKSWKQKAKNTRMGLRAGFPDMVVIAAGKFMAIEMKRNNGAKPTARQKEWIEALQAAGVPTAVCNSTDEAIAFVNSTVKS